MLIKVIIGEKMKREVAACTQNEFVYIKKELQCT